MTNQVTLRDEHLSTIGYLQTRSDGVQVLLDKHLTILGYYDPRTDLTTNAHLSRVGTSGNLLMTLLRH